MPFSLGLVLARCSLNTGPLITVLVYPLSLMIGILILPLVGALATIFLETFPFTSFGIAVRSKLML